MHITGVQDEKDRTSGLAMITTENKLCRGIAGYADMIHKKRNYGTFSKFIFVFLQLNSMIEILPHRRYIHE